MPRTLWDTVVKGGGFPIPAGHCCISGNVVPGHTYSPFFLLFLLFPVVFFLLICSSWPVSSMIVTLYIYKIQNNK